ncbi:hypothetical protein BJ165DRAFT_1501131 [Panaeolus papilionaceus]|nr:hypothetical protein BJ165DRAFT_1501131 [Panaeolus papilionaceus]
MSAINPIFPLEIFHTIITIVGDMAIALDFSSDCFPRIEGFTYDAKSSEKRREWRRSLVSVSQVSQAFRTLCQPYFKMLSIEVSVYRNGSKWTPPTFTTLYLDDKSGTRPTPKCLEMVVGLTYHHWNSDRVIQRGTLLESAESCPPDSLLLELPSLQALHIDVPSAVGNFRARVSYNQPTPDLSGAGLHKLLERYAFGRPKAEIMSQGSYTPLCNDWIAGSTSSLTHLSLSHITDLPLHYLLTSASLIAIELYCCTAVDSQIHLFSASSGAASAGSGGAITLVPRSRSRSSPTSSTSLSQTTPGFKLRSWRVRGGENLISPLLRYCTLLEHLDILQTGPSTAHSNDVQIFQHSLLPAKVPIPEPIPFQNVRSLRWVGKVDMMYFFAFVEAMGEDVKLFPHLREIILDGVSRDMWLMDGYGDMGCGRILSRHVSNLEALTVIRAQPDAFDLSQALIMSSQSLKKLHLRWTIGDGHVRDRPVDACESTLCDGLEAIKGINCLETLEVIFAIFNVNIAGLFLDSEGNNMTHGNRRQICQWMRLSTILSSNPTIDFPLLRRVEMNLAFHSTDEFPASKCEDDYLPSARSMQERLAGLLHMGMHNDGAGNVPRYGEIEVKVKVSFQSENWYSLQQKTHEYEVTADAITGGLVSFHGVDNGCLASS